jgi:hypothetical protein
MRFKVHSSYNLRGGADAMHQTCGALTQLGQYAAMIYHPNVDHLPLLEPFASRYGIVNRETRLENRDDPDTVQMIPAGWGPNWYQFGPDTPSCLKFEGDNLYKSIKIMCWLGIGIWQDWSIEKDMPVDVNHPNLQLCLHACGSQRAFDYLINSGKIAPEKIFFLRDFTNPIFLHEEEHLQNLIPEKEDIVLYNPTKGIEHTEILMAICPDIQFVPLVNMTHEEMRDWGLKSKVCIDFGPFGGREKMHREMAGCGCTIITGNEGASGNPLDVPNGRRKFVRWEGHYDFIAVREQIRYDLAHYAEAMNEPHMVAYRQGVRREQEVSIKDVVNMLSVLGVV